MIPVGSIKVRSSTSSLLEPDNRKLSGLFDYELAGEEINNPNLGFLVRTWKVVVEDGNVNLYRDDVFHSLLFVDDSIADIALSFDQTMNVVIAWQDMEGLVYLRYFDSVSLTFVVMPIGLASCPRLSLDDKRPNASDTCDVIFAYIKDGSLRYRQQREGYLVEHVVVGGLSLNQRLNRIGLGGLQFQFEISSYE